MNVTRWRWLLTTVLVASTLGAVAVVSTHRRVSPGAEPPNGSAYSNVGPDPRYVSSVLPVTRPYAAYWTYGAVVVLVLGGLAVLRPRLRDDERPPSRL